MKRFLQLACAFFVCTGSALAAYPDKPITIIVPFAAGGPTDKTARDLAEAMHRAMGDATLVVENIGGAGGTIGMGKAARAPADGYTILLHHIGMATTPTLYRKAPVNVLDDYTYLGMIQEVPMTLVGRKGLPVSSIRELVPWIATRQGGASLANAGVGSASHLCGLLFMSMAKSRMITVPYKGTGPAMTDLIGGQVDLMCDQTTNTSEQIAAGNLKVLGVTSKRRIPSQALRAVPTLDEQGLKGFDVTSWLGLYAPKGTPKDVADKINAALREALKDQTFVSRQEAMGATMISDDRITPEGHKRFVQSEIVKWRSVIDAAGEFAD